MAYKDEYEVARLLLLDESSDAYQRIGGKRTKVTYHLHPPVMRALGLHDKLKIPQRWGRPMLRLLRAMKPLRGSILDPFRWGEVRRLEREMVPEYVQAVDRLIATLPERGLDDATDIASLPDHVRGYEHLKLERARTYRADLARRLATTS